jgi:F-box-like
VRQVPCTLTSCRLWSALIALASLHLYMQDTPLLNSQIPVSLSTTLINHQANNIQHALQPNRTQKLKSPSRSFFLSIPGESLTHITTYVDDPSSLFALSRVNRRLRDHIADDNTWYRVFAFHFLGIGPESDPQEEQELVLRRTESTWKKEFVSRFRIIWCVSEGV